MSQTRPNDLKTKSIHTESALLLPADQIEAVPIMVTPENTPETKKRVLGRGHVDDQLTKNDFPPKDKNSIDLAPIHICPPDKVTWQDCMACGWKKPKYAFWNDAMCRECKYLEELRSCKATYRIFKRKANDEIESLKKEIEDLKHPFELKKVLREMKEKLK